MLFRLWKSIFLFCEVFNDDCSALICVLDKAFGVTFVTGEREQIIAVVDGVFVGDRNSSAICWSVVKGAENAVKAVRKEFAPVSAAIGQEHKQHDAFMA